MAQPCGGFPPAEVDGVEVEVVVAGAAAEAAEAASEASAVAVLVVADRGVVGRKFIVHGS